MPAFSLTLFSYAPLQSLNKSNIFLSRKSLISYFSNSTLQNLQPDSFSLPERFVSYLEKCPNTSSLKKLHACVITQGLEHNTFLGSKLLSTFAKFDLLAEAKWVFDKIINHNLSLWNSIIVGYFRADQYSEVFLTYLNLRQRNIGIHSSAITFALKSCVELGASQFGMNLHTDAFKFGLSHNQFVGSSLINFYTKCNQIGDAAKVFDEITERDLVAYTSMITGYAQVSDRQSNNAFRVAHDMQLDGLDPNRVTLVSLLQCASRVGLLKNGKSIHGYAVRRNIGSLDEVFETSLLDMYIKCGDQVSGMIIFDKMSKKKSTGSYNALIYGHLQMGHSFEAFSLFREMINNCELDLIGLANGLLSCADLGYLLVGKAIHCRVLRVSINLDLVCTTALIHMYCKCKYLSAAMNVFYRTDDKDDALFKAMIAGYIRNGYVLRAVQTFHQMVSMCIRPNTGTIINVLSALSDIRTCKSVHGYVFRQGFETNTDISNQFINMYAKFGFIGYANHAFDKMIFKDRVSWTSMMTCLVNHGLAHEAITLFLLMQIENINPDCVTFTCLLQALNQLGFVNLVKEVHCRLYRLFLEKDVTLMNSLSTIYSKWGKIEMARNVFDQMSERHLSTWNTMIAAYGMHGDFVQALELIGRMKKDNIVPDAVTFKSILSACSHTGLVEEGLSVFNSMEKEYGIVPSDEHFGCVVDLLGRAGWVEEAYDILKLVPSRRNGSTVGALLAACRVHGNSEIGERVGKWLLDLDPENVSAYCSVSNMYAGGGRWDEVARIGDISKGRGLKRIPGLSRVDLN
ncbi:pentatricopeptide repeat-containing protein at4g21300 [Phtheirospermum japonicum]|uniref:Pentatricopeptide repeat-containing protein at4g21300 n=1 Tax=Phtheirospermum japonicum TaxID=374723 RepID=A0A830C0U5_9LAMI|nr:pentatricopeptide repeat-containing protein at4g21300 [Phtheirospermum japonicum]